MLMADELSRLAQARRALARTTGSHGAAEALYVAQPHNRFYLTGFSGSSGYVLLTQRRAILFTDFRYVEQAEKQAPGYEIVRHGTPYLDTIRDTVGELGLRSIAFEADHLTVAEHAKLVAAVPGVDWIASTGVVEGLRTHKDAAEIRRIEQAVACSDEAFARLVQEGRIRAGATETEVAAHLEHHMRLLGADKPAFDTIVASGPRSSLPHGRASERVIQEGDFVTLDFGAVVGGYCSDITRTVMVGRASSQQRELYQLVLSAQLQGVAAVRPGATGREVDAVSRDIITAAGHGERFGHGLGHGIGLAVHEAPRLSPVSESVLEPGMVFSVEPGVYVPGWGGVRIEDLVVVTGEGCRVLTKTAKELIELR